MTYLNGSSPAPVESAQERYAFVRFFPRFLIYNNELFDLRILEIKRY